tara:strand:+ start:7920 stop:8525 length:606 start_codon:yes stop_codon:yes gene_type:complete
MKNAVLFAFILIQINVSGQNFDIDLLRKVNIDRNPKLDQPFSFITQSDAPISFFIPATILTIGLIKKDSVLRRKALVIGGSLIISTVVSSVIKFTVKRDRPFVTYPEVIKLTGGGSPSFPSGHTSLAFSTATSLSLMFPKWYVITPAYLWAGAVGYSRMHLGVHYPSDVLIGGIIGAGSALLSKWVVTKMCSRKKNTSNLI